MSDDDRTTETPERRALAVVLALLAAGAFGFATISQHWIGHRATQLQYQLDGERTAVFPIGPVHEIGFGLRSMYECPNGRDCDDHSNAEFVADWRLKQLRARFLLLEQVDDELEDLVGSAELAQLARIRIGSDENLGRVLELRATKQVYATSGAFVAFGWIALFACAVAALSLATASALVIANKRPTLRIMPTTIALLATAVALFTGCVFVALKPGPAGYVGVGIGFLAFAGGVILSLWSSLALNKLLRPRDPDLLEDAMNPDQF